MVQTPESAIVELIDCPHCQGRGSVEAERESRWMFAENPTGTIIYVAHPEAQPVRLVLIGGVIELVRIEPLPENHRASDLLKE